MTAIRTSLAFALEDTFCGGPGIEGRVDKGKGKWLAAPPNSFFTHGHQRSTNRMNSAGTKKFDYIAYGGYSGSWSWSFTADYNYLEPFLAAFEMYSSKTYGYSYHDGKSLQILKEEDKTESNLIIEDNIQKVVVGSDGTDVHKYPVINTVYQHTFQKSDAGRVPSMCFRRVQLNKQVGGKHGDEILEIYGAICTELRLSCSAGSSQVQVNMSGVSAKEAMKITSLTATEYKAYEGEHVMFACLFNSGTPSSESYVADVQTLQVAIKNNAERLWSTCSPFMTNYYEGITNYELTANVYSKDPTLFRQRLYTGGQDIVSTMPNFKTSTWLEGADAKNIYYLQSPLCKGLAPMPAMTISSYDTCRDIEANQDLGTTIDQADFRMDIYATDIVFKTMSWERGDSSKIMDNLSSAECREMKFVVYSNIPSYENPSAKRYLDIPVTNMIKNNIPEETTPPETPGGSGGTEGSGGSGESGGSGGSDITSP